MKVIVTRSLVLSLVVVSTLVMAADEDSYSNYDDIVSDLKYQADDVKPPTLETVDWDAVALHGGIGLATSYITVESPDGIQGTGLLKGFEANAGANLFSRQARAEAVFRSFAKESLDNDLFAELRELEGRIVFLPTLDRQTILRMGAGLSYRYMDLSARKFGRWTRFESTTPSSGLLVGLERKVAKMVSVGPDLSYRSAMKRDTYDRSSWNAAIRLNAQF